MQALMHTRQSTRKVGTRDGLRVESGSDRVIVSVSALLETELRCPSQCGCRSRRTTGGEYHLVKRFDRFRAVVLSCCRTVVLSY